MTFAPTEHVADVTAEPMPEGRVQITFWQDNGEPLGKLELANADAMRLVDLLDGVIAKLKAMH